MAEVAKQYLLKDTGISADIHVIKDDATKAVGSGCGIM